MQEARGDEYRTERQIARQSLARLLFRALIRRPLEAGPTVTTETASEGVSI